MVFTVFTTATSELRVRTLVRPGKRPTTKMGIELRSVALEADAIPLGQGGATAGRQGGDSRV